MSDVKLTHPIHDDEFISWLKTPMVEYQMGRLLAFYNQELEMLKGCALRRGDTEIAKGEVMGLSRFLKPFTNLADTETETGE